MSEHHDGATAKRRDVDILTLLNKPWQKAFDVLG